jgi:hypothetical protein
MPHEAAADGESMSLQPEGRGVAEAQADRIATPSWEALDAYGAREETITAPSGRTLIVKSSAHWDMDDWASGMNISVRVYAPSGLRRIWGYKEWRTRGGPDDPVPEWPGS